MHEQGKVNIVSMFHFLETDIREQKKYKMRTQISVVDNTVNDMNYESSFKTAWKKKITFLLGETLLFFLEQKYILGDNFFKIPKNLFF